MSGIVSYFRGKFVASNEGSPDELIDISSFINERIHWSPLLLPYNDRNSSIKNLAAAIIYNFANAHVGTIHYPRRGLNLLNEIIVGSLASADVVAQQLLMVHISKRAIEIEQFLYIMWRTTSMVVDVNLSRDRREWIKLVEKVTRHSEINALIEEYEKDLGVSPQVSGEEKDVISITLVEKGVVQLRGFVGFNEIFIHCCHFDEKITSFRGTEKLLEMICKIDIISLAIHELAHIKIRKSNGNFNMHTLAVAALKQPPSNCHEFGAYVEKKLFGCQVDFFKSATYNLKYLDTAYFEAFINAVERNTSLPPLRKIPGALQRVEVPGMGGADLDLYNEYVC